MAAWLMSAAYYTLFLFSFSEIHNDDIMSSDFAVTLCMKLQEGAIYVYMYFTNNKTPWQPRHMVFFIS